LQEKANKKALAEKTLNHLQKNISLQKNPKTFHCKKEIHCKKAKKAFYCKKQFIAIKPKTKAIAKKSKNNSLQTRANNPFHRKEKPTMH